MSEQSRQFPHPHKASILVGETNINKHTKDIILSRDKDCEEQQIRAEGFISILGIFLAGSL